MLGCSAFVIGTRDQHGLWLSAIPRLRIPSLSLSNLYSREMLLCLQALGALHDNQHEQTAYCERSSSGQAAMLQSWSS